MPRTGSPARRRGGGPRCTMASCARRAFRSGLCRTHYARRGDAIRHYGRTRWQALTEAALAYAEVDATDPVAFRKAQALLRVAAHRYVGKRP